MVGMPSLDDARPRWAVAAAAPGADVVEVRGLRDGGSPWLLRLSLDGRERGVVLRVGRDPAPLRTEVAALRLAERHGIPAPRLVAADLDADPPVVLTEQLAGSSARSQAWLSFGTPQGSDSAGEFVECRGESQPGSGVYAEFVVSMVMSVPNDVARGAASSSTPTSSNAKPTDPIHRS